MGVLSGKPVTPHNLRAPWSRFEFRSNFENARDCKNWWLKSLVLTAPDCLFHSKIERDDPKEKKKTRKN